MDRAQIAATIRVRYASGERICDLAREYGLAWQTASNYAKSRNYSGANKKPRHWLPIDQVRRIKRALEEGVKPIAIAVEEGVGESTVRHYALGTRRRDVAA